MESTTMIAVSAAFFAAAAGTFAVGLIRFHKERAAEEATAERNRDSHAEKMEKIRSIRALLDGRLADTKNRAKLADLKSSAVMLKELLPTPPLPGVGAKTPTIANEIDAMVAMIDEMIDALPTDETAEAAIKSEIIGKPPKTLTKP